MLNPQQRAAMTYIEGPLLVLAGAGSGKTRVITQKIAYLIEDCGYPASSVCAVTFTNKAANEMRERVNALLDAKHRRGLKVATFHRLGLDIIKKNAAFCGLKKGFTIFDSEDCLHLLQKYLPSGRAKDRDYLMQIQQQISGWKNDLLSPEDVTAEHVVAEEAQHIYPFYQSSLRAYNAVDFDDLIGLPVQLLAKCPEVLEYWQNKIRYLLIDEYQDSNSSQYRFVKLLAGVKAQFTVVGDDDQSIYAWRGARPENLIQLQNDFPQLKVIKLEQNYRSTGRILHAANHLIANNRHLFTKKLWSDLGHGELLRVLSCKDELDEAEQVIADLISHKLRTGACYGQYAILYRGNHQSRVFEKILRQQGIPYRINGGQSWFSRTEVKDIFAYLKLLVNEKDDAAFLRIINTPKRGIGEASLNVLGHYAQSRHLSLYESCDHLALSELMADKPRMALQQFKQWLENIKRSFDTMYVAEQLRQMVEDSGYEAWLYEQAETPAKAQKRMENVWELVEWVGRLFNKKPENTLADVINTLILIDILEQSDEQDVDRVQLMTLHASKGLEFPFVYLVGMEENVLPHRVSIEDGHIEEERRLAYVGITRAQKTLCMTLAKKRRRDGELQDSLPSRFLEELPQDSLEWFGRLGERNEERSKALAKTHLSGLKNLLKEKQVD
ncbi:ATP-dependent DNA helicase Rep [Legionella israelensis]|uniref:ATP-dependent DNA helicase Rep n=1 Tax=Legionella israelensis TaxID=454 RepID=A0AAX1EJF8_9GAMM|nr:UvrD-helicase domain-containing protein [Legionella israelensis]QBR85154.1 ATP-dependent DNA helicase Rep [Legionella israelensis]